MNLSRAGVHSDMSSSSAAFSAFLQLSRVVACLRAALDLVQESTQQLLPFRCCAAWLQCFSPPSWLYRRIAGSLDP